MSAITSALAARLDRELSLTDVERDKLSLGLACLESSVLSFSVMFVTAWLLGVLRYTALIALAVAVLRVFSGGAHASTAYRCAIVGTVVNNSLALLARYAANAGISSDQPYILIATAITWVVGWRLIKRLAPRDTPEKPITSEMHRARLRNGSLMSVSVLMTLTASLSARPALSLPLLFGAIWQLFSLTTLAATLVERVVDRNATEHWRGGESE